jgi:hypothetical protein
MQIVKMFAALILAAGVMQTLVTQAHAEQTSFVSVARHGQTACRTREYRPREYRVREYGPRVRQSRCSEFLHNGYDHSPCRRHSRAP